MPLVLGGIARGQFPNHPNAFAADAFCPTSAPVDYAIPRSDNRRRSRVLDGQSKRTTALLGFKQLVPTNDSATVRTPS
jgi:hypothetical protein